MADSLVEELRQRSSGEAARARRDWQERTTSEEPTGGTDVEEVEVNTTAYGFFRGVRDRATHLELQRLRGSWPAPGYAWLPCPQWFPAGTVPSRGQAIVLEYVTGLKVTIRGRNLRALYDQLLRQRVYRVTEMGEEADTFLPEQAPVVYAIDVEELQAK